MAEQSAERITRCAILTLALMVATIDRGILSVLVEHIKHDLHVSDTQFSVLTGFAFVFFYAFLGLPIARLADRHSRRLIIGVGIAFWSLMTACSGIAQSYQQLFWARVAVGAGESSFAPATYSILTDSFPPAKLPVAMSLLSIGFVCGGGFSLVAGGAALQAVAAIGPVALPGIGALHSWQLVFFLVGIPGLIIALLMTTVGEPERRGLLATVDGVRPEKVPIRVIGRFLSEERRTFLPIFAAMGIKTLLSFGAIVWTPAFFVRTYGWPMSQSAYRLGLVSYNRRSDCLRAVRASPEYYVRRGPRRRQFARAAFATVAVVAHLDLWYPLTMPSAGAALIPYGLNFFLASDQVSGLAMQRCKKSSR